ncbi:MAG: GIY-YIG nuclease family protein [Parcubacteria group bacterium]|nr:GIY-YIG nuclease family protein [Parcubacteria group bacterium]
MTYFVYVLKSLSDKKRYIGCTTDLERRITEHNAGKTFSLKGRCPLVLLYSERYDNQEAAYKREKQNEHSSRQAARYQEAASPLDTLQAAEYSLLFASLGSNGS